VLHNQNREKWRECQNCHARVRYLRNHLTEKHGCATYYQENFEGASIHGIVNKLIKDSRNSRRAAKRREDAENGNARDRTIEIDQRRNQSFL
jgi:hypothetical protein